jgi:hypothetical protein
LIYVGQVQNGYFLPTKKKRLSNNRSLFFIFTEYLFYLATASCVTIQAALMRFDRCFGSAMLPFTITKLTFIILQPQRQS